MRLPCALLSLALLPACGDGGPSPEEPRGALTLTAQVEAKDGALVPLTEGAEVPYVWGPQGGTMLRPTFALAPGAARAGEIFEVRVEHGPDPDAPAAFGEMGQFEPLSLRAEAWADEGGALHLGPFNHQLGWDELAGGRLIYALTVRRGPDRWTQRVTLLLVSADPSGPCAGVPSEGGYRRITGTLHVTRLEPAGGSCAEGVSVLGRFTASEADRPCLDSLAVAADLSATELTVVALGQVGCLANAGLTVGADVPAVAEIIEHGTSAPWIVAPEAEVAACAEACL